MIGAARWRHLHQWGRLLPARGRRGVICKVFWELIVSIRGNLVSAVFAFSGWGTIFDSSPLLNNFLMPLNSFPCSSYNCIGYLYEIYCLALLGWLMSRSLVFCVQVLALYAHRRKTSLFSLLGMHWFQCQQWMQHL